MKSKKGFTLIELLVVIAIIGILAAIVLVSLRGAPARAKNAKIKADVTQVRGIAEMIYSDNAHGDYEDLCDSVTDVDTLNDLLTDYPQLKTLEDDMTDQGSTVTCHSSAEFYCVSASLLVDEGDFCVDSTGMAKTHSAGAACEGTNFDCVAP